MQHVVQTIATAWTHQAIRADRLVDGLQLRDLVFDLRESQVYPREADAFDRGGGDDPDSKELRPFLQTFQLSILSRLLGLVLFGSPYLAFPLGLESRLASA